jgi:hypothetical protein
LPEDWKIFFKKVGIQEKELKEPETANLIFQSVNEMQKRKTKENKVPQAPKFDRELLKIKNITPNCMESESIDLNASIRSARKSSLKKVEKPAFPVILYFIQ